MIFRIDLQKAFDINQWQNLEYDTLIFFYFKNLDFIEFYLDNIQLNKMAVTRE